MGGIGSGRHKMEDQGKNKKSAGLKGGHGFDKPKVRSAGLKGGVGFDKPKVSSKLNKRHGFI